MIPVWPAVSSAVSEITSFLCIVHQWLGGPCGRTCCFRLVDILWRVESRASFVTSVVPVRGKGWKFICFIWCGCCWFLIFIVKGRKMMCKHRGYSKLQKAELIFPSVSFRTARVTDLGAFIVCGRFCWCQMFHMHIYRRFRNTDLVQVCRLSEENSCQQRKNLNPGVTLSLSTVRETSERSALYSG